METPRFLVPLSQAAIAKSGDALIMNPQSTIDLDQLAEHLVIETDRADLFKLFHTRGLDVHPRVNGDGFSRALVFLGKHSEQNKAMIGRAWDMVKEGGDILIEGAKTDGVDSVARGLRALGLSPNIEPKSHGKIIWFPREQAKVGAINTWRDADLPKNNPEGFVTRPGMFSHNATDKGTAFLLETLSKPLKGKLGELGCGYGAVARPLLARNPDIESVDLFELSHLAVECAKENITDPRAHLHWLDVQDAPRGYFDVVISNPPFHQGRAAEPNLGLNFIDAAANSLRPRGIFYLVANRHLPYENRLEARFGHVELLAQSPAFKVYAAKRPKKA